MRRIIGFLLGGTLAVLLTRYHILDGGEVQATRYALDAVGLGLWREAATLFGHAAGLKLLVGLAVGGSLGTAIQYLVERQMQMGRR